MPGVKSPPFAAERDQVLGMATVATHAQEPVLEAAAREVVFELLLQRTPSNQLTALRQGRALRCHMRLERR